MPLASEGRPGADRYLLETVSKVPGGGSARDFSSFTRREAQRMRAASASIRNEVAAEKHRRADPADF